MQEDPQCTGREGSLTASTVFRMMLQTHRMFTLVPNVYLEARDAIKHHSPGINSYTSPSGSYQIPVSPSGSKMCPSLCFVLMKDGGVIVCWGSAHLEIIVQPYAGFRSDLLFGSEKG